MNDFMLLVGRHFSTLPTLADQQGSELQLDSLGRLIISGRYLEDSPHSSGDAGLFAMGVRDDGVQASSTVGPNVFTAVNYGTSGNSISLVFDGIDDVSTVVAAWNAANPANQVSFSGSGATVPSAQTVNLSGGASNTVWTSAHGDYSPIALDKYGRLQVVAAVSIEPSDAEFAEDSPNASGDVGLHVLAVRQDTLATSTSANGDYADFKVNALGELYVHDTDVKTELVAANVSLDAIESDVDAIRVELLDQGTSLDNIDTSLNNIETTVSNIDTSLNNIETSVSNIDTDTTNIDNKLGALSKAEDAAHSSGDMGIMALGVRNDSNTVLTSNDGDYSPLAVDSAGRLKVMSTEAMEGAEQYAVTDALAAGGDGLITITAAATPWVTAASYSHTSGTAYLMGWQFACDQNADARVITDNGVDIVVYKEALNSSAMPTYAEHWAKEGRIEIAGAAGLSIKLQIKKRSTTGGNANGSGSLHLRA